MKAEAAVQETNWFPNRDSGLPAGWAFKSKNCNANFDWPKQDSASGSNKTKIYACVAKIFDN